MKPESSLARSRYLGRASKALAALSAVALVVMMSITFVGVVMRYAFNAPILGVNEIVQLMSVSMVMLALPYATQTDAHVRIDVLDGKIGRYGRLFGDILARLVGGYVLIVLVTRAWRRLADAFEYGDATNMLRLSLWPFYGLIVLGICLVILIFALQIIDLLRRGRSYDD
ncbi:TRAP transporter small permease [Sinisalibacter aestuarii]|uniref:TRAP transporter small permease protein n=1 Tax=Sinisalibacter aestuarii TaxID=2949426 RepID=A0ABQ5LZ78_9RHOB|nr:TRAP transporter small permease [Sinisalibacter aestuarii]GKY89928.1 hypothetical protein STA1M1_37970 [Sinisalibacter aestuarii]